MQGELLAGLSAGANLLLKIELSFWLPEPVVIAQN
jgi:hypothetical protein